jgi:hypothetical protein
MRARIESGQIKGLDTPGWRRKLARFDGQAVEIRLEAWAAPRSVQQNRYYWGVVVEGAREVFRYSWGQILTPATAHRILKSIFLGKEEVVNRKTGEVVLIGGSTTELSTREMTSYIESIRAWALEEAQIVIDPPDYSEEER